ncbi:MAG: peptidyl-prolyl cis-trans isomerase, partial [Spirochaetaceae bacterium]|nr:peptidyl-prolyl cis-trans isomerase [Spirochaetaceae bacterium]
MTAKRLATAAVLLFLRVAGAGGMDAALPAAPQPDGPGVSEIAATVVDVRIGADQVFELWAPIWYETLAKVRNGKLDAGEGDRLLTAEWRRALRALIKDEVFFQEAGIERQLMINGYAEQLLSRGDPRPRRQISAEIRRLFDQDMERQFRQLSADFLRESGGRVKLGKVLESRNLTFADWQNRLRKKALGQSYLRQVIQPTRLEPGPKEIQAHYANHPDEFSRPGPMRFRHIFFSRAGRGAEAAREAAIEAWQELAEEEIEFEKAAARFSDDPVSRNRGGLETDGAAADPEREAWLADVRAALREETPGKLAPILESLFGFHVAELISIGPERKIPFAEVSRDIERKIQAARWEAETEERFRSV